MSRAFAYLLRRRVYKIRQSTNFHLNLSRLALGERAVFEWGGELQTFGGKEAFLAIDSATAPKPK
jgi:hypothetical protein